MHQGYSQPITLSSAHRLPFNITPSVEIFRDSAGQMNLKQAAFQKYQNSPKDHFIFPYISDAFWARFTITNTDIQTKNWYLVWGNPLAEQLDFYISDSTDRRFLHTQQKLLTYRKDKKMIDQEPKFEFELGPKQTKRVYIKLTSKRGHYGSLRIHSEASYFASRLNDYSGQSFFNGLVVFRLFSVISWSLFVIKDVPSGLYSLHTVIKTFAFWGYLNIAGPWFTDDPAPVQKIDFLMDNSIIMGTVVENNSDLRKYIREIFEGSYQLMEAADGQEGLEKAGSISEIMYFSKMFVEKLGTIPSEWNT